MSVWFLVKETKVIRVIGIFAIFVFCDLSPRCFLFRTDKTSSSGRIGTRTSAAAIVCGIDHEVVDDANGTN